MKQTTNKPNETTPDAPRFLQRISDRISVPSIVAGIVVILLFAFSITANRDNQERYQAPAPDTSSNSKPSTPASDAEFNPVIATIDPALQELERKIEGLKEANQGNWQESKMEVVQAWENLNTKYDALVNEMTNG